MVVCLGFKIPLYASWAGLSPLSQNDISKYSDIFSTYVFNSISSTQALPGVVEYIKSIYTSQNLYVSSASSFMDLKLYYLTLVYLTVFVAFLSPSSKDEHISNLISSKQISLTTAVLLEIRFLILRFLIVLSLISFVFSQSMYPHSWPSLHPGQQFTMESIFKDREYSS